MRRPARAASASTSLALTLALVVGATACDDPTRAPSPRHQPSRSTHLSPLSIDRIEALDLSSVSNVSPANCAVGEATTVDNQGRAGGHCSPASNTSGSANTCIIWEENGTGNALWQNTSPVCRKLEQLFDPDFVVAAAHSFIGPPLYGDRAGAPAIGLFGVDPEGRNNAGYIYGTTGGMIARAVRFHWTTPTQLENLGPLTGNSTLVRDVNRAGTAVGVFDSLPPGQTTFKPFGYRWTAAVSLERVSDQGFGSLVQGVDENGEMVGWTADPTISPTTATWWSSPNTFRLLAKSPGSLFCSANARSNRADIIVGGCVEASGRRRAMLWRTSWSPSVLEIYQQIEQAIPGAESSELTSINTAGTHAVGYYADFLGRRFPLRIRFGSGATLPNSPPDVLFAGDTLPVDVGATASFFVQSTDPDGDTMLGTIDFGDGTSAPLNPVSGNIVHTYTSPGTYTATVTVDDGNGGVTTRTTTVTVVNKAPFVSAGPDQQQLFGTQFTLGASFSDGLGFGPWTYYVGWGDGTFAQGKVATPGPLTLAKTYTRPGTWTVVVGVGDRDGRWTTDRTVFRGEATINNPPVADAGGPYAAAEQEAITFNATGSSDPDGNTLFYHWDFGDGTFSVAASPTKKYDDSRTYTVTLTVSDLHGGKSTVTTMATISNALPRANFGVSPVAIVEGRAFTLSVAGVSDPSAADRAAGLEYAFDCGDGTGPTPYQRLAFGFAAAVHGCGPVTDDDIRAVGAYLRDKDGGVTSYTRTFETRNAAPVVTPPVVTTGPVVFGQSVGIRGSFTDAGVADGPWTVEIRWGDGTPPTVVSVDTPGQFAAGHLYASRGTKPVSYTVTDKDGGRTASGVILVVVP